MEPRAHAHHRIPTIGAILAAGMAVLLCAAILDLQEWWRPSAGIGPETSARLASAGGCHRCGVIESVRSIDEAEPGSQRVALRGFGDDLMSVLALVAGAMVGNRIRPEADAAAVHEITVRFEDGSSRVLRIVGGRNWERGERVEVVQGRIRAAG